MLRPKHLLEAVSYEALVLLLEGDRERAAELMDELKVTDSEPLPYFSALLAERLSATEERINELYRTVRSSFEQNGPEAEIIKLGEDDTLQYSGEEPLRYLYAAGRLELLKGKSVTILGMPVPTIQGRSDLTKALSLLIKNDIAIVAPLESGIPAMALSYALKEGGKAIGVLSTNINSCSSSSLLALQAELYEKGLLITQFAPSIKNERWHVVLRNRVLAGLSKGVFLVEDKDGGPSWPIFDGVLKGGKKCMLSLSIYDNPNCSYASFRVEQGALIFKKERDILKLVTLTRKRRAKKENLTPDLFSEQSLRE